MIFKRLIVLISILTFSCFAQNSENKYSIGVFATPPLSLINKNGKPDGLIINLLDEIANQQNIQINWVFDDWTDHYNRIKNNRLDMITSVGFTEERAQFLDYSKNSFVTVWGQVYLPSNSNIETILDLNNKTIAILKDGVNGIRFKNQCIEFDIQCNIVEFEDYEDIFKELSLGKLDAGVANNLVGNTFAKTYNVINSAIVFNPFKVYVAIPKGNDPYLLNQFDQFIQKWKQQPDSFFYQKRLQWLKPPVPNNIPKLIFLIISGLLILVLFSMTLAFFFKRQINKRISELIGREQQLNQIINLVPHMIYVADEDGNIVLANKIASEFFGMSQTNFELSNLSKIRKRNSNFSTILDDSKVINKNNSSASHKEVETTDYEDNRHILYLSKMPFLGRQDNARAVVTVAVDITDSKSFEEKIKFMAHHDALTGLPNRTLLNERLENSLKTAYLKGHCGAILFIDIDYFKNINDSQGHQIGDLLIKKVAHRLKLNVRPGDTIARLGGDEYIIELAELEPNPVYAESDAIRVGELILESLAKPYYIDDQVYHMTVSMGLVIYPRDGNNKDILLQRADIAMYKAKSLGRNQLHVFNPSLENNVKSQHLLENDLRVAIKEDQLFLEFQPVVMGEKTSFAGVEALIRWKHPKQGIIYPNNFIQIAEQKKFIIEIGSWVLEQACQQIQTWIQQGKKKFFIAVNVSVVQLKDDNFYKIIQQVINKYKIPHNYLELEVTESILMQEMKRSISLFKKLKILGVRISIDDFGTGYSSFKYLIRLPLDKIKIDRHFIKNLPDDPNSVTIVTTILRMAKELGMEVVAEGVESQQQYEFLLSHCCNYFQGYLFHKPTPIEQLKLAH